jgi:hypothetical protein
VTLVLTFATPDYVIQASDRRFRWIDRHGVVVRENDDSNKAVVWRGRSVWSFAGLGDLGNQENQRRTDLWLARQLNEIETVANAEGRDMEWALAKLAERCNEEFQRQSIADLEPLARLHTFIAAGWGTLGGTHTDLRPYTAGVTNRGPDGDPLPEFMPDWHFPEPETSWLGYTALLPSDDERAAYLEQLGAVYAYGGLPAAIVSLRDRIRQIAEINPDVGDGVIVNVIPRAAIRSEAEGIVLLNGPIDTAPTFHYYPSSSTQPDFAYGPVLVGGGNVISDISGRGGVFGVMIGGPLNDLPASDTSG